MSGGFLMLGRRRGNGGEAGEFLSIVDIISRRRGVIERASFLRLLNAVMDIFSKEPPDTRPRSERGYPGGLVHLRQDIPTVIIPDIHGRVDFIPRVLRQTDAEGVSFAERLLQGRIQLLCLGDAFHGEARAARRWQEAFKEFALGYRIHRAMDAEMGENFAVMETILYLKARFPSYVHFLKGNHENILNENENGNYGFGKFVNEGEMVKQYVEMFLGGDFLIRYGEFEHCLPILAAGKGFLASHAEPDDFYPREKVINYRENPEVIYGLTWTGNDQAAEGSVGRMLEHYLPPGVRSRYFGGHRPVDGLFALRASGRYVQINNPERKVIAVLGTDGDTDPARTVRPVR